MDAASASPGTGVRERSLGTASTGTERAFGKRPTSASSTVCPWGSSASVTRSEHSIDGEMSDQRPCTTSTYDDECDRGFGDLDVHHTGLPATITFRRVI